MRGRIGGAAWLAIGTFAVATVINVVWALVDQDLPDYDAGRHLLYAVSYRDAFATGDLLYPLTSWDPGQLGPLTYVVGALSMLLGGIDDDPAIIAADLIFGGALAFGCYGAGRRAFGSTAGALAVVFAFGAPLVVSQLHTFLADLPAAALVALAAWLLFDSDRLTRLGPAAAAGVAIGLGVLTRPEVAVWLLGLIVVMLVRGAWRQWRGVLVLGVAALVVGGPWYVLRWDDLRDRADSATRANPGSVGDVQGLIPDRFSGQNLGWYSWSTLNIELFLPLFLLALGGAVWAAVRYVRNRDERDFTPELIGGYLTGYVLQTLVFTLKDPRYALPGLVYLCVLGTGWIAAIGPPRRRMLAAAAVIAIAVLNVATIDLGIGGTLRATLPGAPDPPSLPRHREIIVASNGRDIGLAATTPEDTGEPLLRVMEGARRDGARYVWFGGSDFPLFFAPAGLTFFARAADLNFVRDGHPEFLGPKDVSLIKRAVEPGFPEPCVRLPDGTGIYVGRGQEWRIPPSSYRPYCPIDD
ncbi:MAG TPA: glycosyltransferase family 39 protein [Thermoleophilaceae bacterium]|jgi:4-amino-4-deoxy-L-arabinose transferase-like glycosyltransferase